jgi:AcrR family transcriptional regulator
VSNSGRPDVQQPDREPDPRVARTLSAMGAAIAAELAARPFHALTVQHILDRSGVSRATFYAHFRNKEDALYWSFERMFRGFESRMDGPGAPRGRLLPLRELLEHVSEAGPVVDSMRASGQLDRLWDYGTDLCAEMILRRSPDNWGEAERLDPRLAARMLAAAAMEMARWWVDGQRSAVPDALDAQWHAMAARSARW